MEAADSKPLRNFETATMVIGLLVGSLLYGIAAFAYVHSNFMPRAEAEARARNRDKFEQTVMSRFDRLEDNLDRILDKK